jgi:hypothetical protein
MITPEPMPLTSVLGASGSGPLDARAEWTVTTEGDARATASR